MNTEELMPCGHDIKYKITGTQFFCTISSHYCSECWKEENAEAIRERDENDKKALENLKEIGYLK